MPDAHRATGGVQGGQPSRVVAELGVAQRLAPSGPQALLQGEVVGVEVGRRGLRRGGAAEAEPRRGASPA